jgi:hypothetical protein
MHVWKKDPVELTDGLVWCIYTAMKNDCDDSVVEKVNLMSKIKQTGFGLEVFFFSKHSTDSGAHKYVHKVISMSAHMYIPYLYERIRETESKKPIMLVLRLKSRHKRLTVSKNIANHWRIFHLYETSKCQTWGLKSDDLGVPLPSNHNLWFIEVLSYQIVCLGMVRINYIPCMQTFHFTINLLSTENIW